MRALALLLALATAATAQETRSRALRYATAAELIAVLAPHLPEVTLAPEADPKRLTLRGPAAALSRADFDIANLDLPSPPAAAVEISLHAAGASGPARIFTGSVVAGPTTTARFDLSRGRATPAEGVSVTALQGRVALRGLETGYAQGELKLAVDLVTPSGPVRLRFGAPLLIVRGLATEVGTVQVAPDRTVRVEVSARELKP